MKYTGSIAWLCVIALGGFACKTAAPRPDTAAPAATAAAVAPALPAAASAVERGAYLATISGCAGCHTPWGPAGRDSARLYGGSPGRKPGQGGTPNISPDPGTGIGTWSDAEIIAAIREARRPDGTRLSPHMPCASYHGLTDADAAALVAYLRSVPPVVQKIERAKSDDPPVDLPPATGNTDPADPVKHGAYLAGLMRCQGCHTPRSGPAAGKLYAGGNEFGGPAGKMYSSNLTSDPETGLGTWTVADVATAVRELIAPDHTEIGGPMAWHKDEWSKLTDADATALGTFIKALPAVKNKIPSPTAGGTEPKKK